ncbi:hypothetical protein [Zhihengliuella halotolerans]|uniref:Uncharacterized protein n=1 Tax=Zhihengliuella halotolerans TaxID=370736 RepID=A0A4V2G9U3_9MICC|nr:hypothetical protein [Zhihengliuella halotolerans]RZU61726.1 hypothetical protein EV380_1304 [Zhihengliuella halotolerans]
MTTTAHTTESPLDYANAPTYIGDDGVEYVDERALMALAETEADGWAPLFERLARQ